MQKTGQSSKIEKSFEPVDVNKSKILDEKFYSVEEEEFNQKYSQILKNAQSSQAPTQAPTQAVLQAQRTSGPTAAEGGGPPRAPSIPSMPHLGN